MAIFERAFVIVLDSVGIGELPDATSYGDEGSDTLGNISRQTVLSVPTLQALGLGNIATLPGIPPADRPRAAFGRMAEASPGKDSVTGHWEIAGLHLIADVSGHSTPAAVVVSSQPRSATSRRIAEPNATGSRASGPLPDRSGAARSLRLAAPG